MYGYIYKTTNLINGKIYIGQHKANRFDIKYKGSGKILLQAFHKYGKNNFSCHIIEWCNSKQELNIKEKFWIKFFHTQNPNIGYNITSGGEGTENYRHSTETIQKIKNSNKGKKRSLETCKNISNSHKGIKSCMKGKHHSEETKQKISIANTGKRNKSVLLFKDNILIFIADNQFKCAEFLNVKENTISRALNRYNGKYKNYYIKRL